MKPEAVARLLRATMLGLSVFAKTSPGRKALTDVADTALSVLDA